MVLRKHDVTLEFNRKEKRYILNVDGYTIYLTKKDMNNMLLPALKGSIDGAIEISEYLKQQDSNLYDTKLTPIADNQNTWDIMELIRYQFEKPISTRKSPES